MYAIDYGTRIETCIIIFCNFLLEIPSNKRIWYSTAPRDKKSIVVPKDRENVTDRNDDYSSHAGEPEVYGFFYLKGL